MDLSVDFHIHSDNSVDAHSPVDEMCRAASEKGFTAVCFTEHVDMNPEDDGFGYFNFDKYSADIARARDKYGSKLNVLKGIEFSEPHLYPREFGAMTARDFDYILASVHYVEGFGGYWNDEKRLQPGYPVEQLYEAYYRSILKTIDMGGFDAIAHLDIPKRYLPEKYEPEALLDSVLVGLVEKGIALEVNSYPVHKGYNELNPSDAICEMYAKRGGTRVTIGSDAHTPGRIGQDFDRIARVIEQYSFKPVLFVQRKATLLHPKRQE